MPKKIERGDSLVSPGMVCYAEKQVKPFWSSSLCQMVQFDTIIFCRTFENYFGQFVWIEKKRVTIIVAFHFMKRRLKNTRETNPRKNTELQNYHGSSTTRQLRETALTFSNTHSTCRSERKKTRINTRKTKTTTFTAGQHHKRMTIAGSVDNKTGHHYINAQREQ